MQPSAITLVRFTKLCQIRISINCKEVIRDRDRHHLNVLVASLFN